MNTSHKTEVHVWVTAAIMQVMGTKSDAAAGSSIQVILDEVPEGNAGGHTISLESIAESVGMRKDSDRFAWVRSYFEAKARQLTMFGYPSDVSGLVPWIAKKVVNSARPGKG
jgi:hypothetical protein